LKKSLKGYILQRIFRLYKPLVQISTSLKRQSKTTKKLLTNSITSGMVTAIQPVAETANELFK